MKNFLLWIWQLPQNIVGFILTRFAVNKFELTANDMDRITVYFTNNVFNCGVSLGKYIILDNKNYYPIRYTNMCMVSINHENGHRKQSQKLGWLYFIIIGIPSSIGNIIFRIFKLDTSKYYKQPWEHWADKLGGVIR